LLPICFVPSNRAQQSLFLHPSIQFDVVQCVTTCPRNPTAFPFAVCPASTSATHHSKQLVQWGSCTWNHDVHRRIALGALSLECQTKTLAQRAGSSGNRRCHQYAPRWFAVGWMIATTLCIRQVSHRHVISTSYFPRPQPRCLQRCCCAMKCFFSVLPYRICSPFVRSPCRRARLEAFYVISGASSMTASCAFRESGLQD
jgi:hypothetical protein